MSAPLAKVPALIAACEKVGIAHNGEAGGQWVLCATDAELQRLEAALAHHAAPAPYGALVEAVDNVLSDADCECPNSMRHDRGEHLSGCFLFDLNIERQKVAAPPAKAEAATVKNSLTDDELVDIARAVGLRSALHGISVTDARALLRAFVDRVAATPARPSEARVPMSWQPISTAPTDELVIVFWKAPNEDEHPERYDFDLLEEGVWQKHHDDHEHYLMVGGPKLGPGPGEQAPYTHWLRLGMPDDRQAGPPAKAGILDWPALLQAEIDHAVINDLRLEPHFGQRRGENAVRVSTLEALLARATDPGASDSEGGEPA